jgi:TPR repeat protein
LAATDGDAPSMKALAIAHSEAGDEETAAYWFERATTAQPVGVTWPALLAMGETVADSDVDAADECFRRAAHQDSVRGAWLYGRRAVQRDPVEGLYYLAMAAGAGPEHPESLAAHRLIQQLQAGWGTRRTREYVARATERMRTEVYGDAPSRRGPTAVVAVLIVAFAVATVVVYVVVNAYVAAVFALLALAGGIAVRRWFVRTRGG